MAQSVDQDDPSRMVFHAVLLGVAVPVLVLSFLLEVEGPSKVLIPWFGVPLPATCGMQRMWSLDCPGCGLTRSFIMLAHGDVAASLAFNPAGVLVFAFIAFQVPYRLAQLWRCWRRLPAWNLIQPGLWGWATIGVVLIVQWGMKVLSLG